MSPIARPLAIRPFPIEHDTEAQRLSSITTHSPQIHHSPLTVPPSPPSPFIPHHLIPTPTRYTSAQPLTPHP